jgi:hypothetical protein
MSAAGAGGDPAANAPEPPCPGGFDFPAFRDAVEGRDVERWLGFFAEEARWIEYRRENPPGSPRLIAGKAEIRAWLEKIEPVPAELVVSHELIGATRIAYRLTVTFLPDRRQIVEHVISELDDAGRIARQVDVEISDP